LNLKELEGKKKYAKDLQKVADEPAMGQNDIDELNKRVRHRYFYCKDKILFGQTTFYQYSQS